MNIKKPQTYTRQTQTKYFLVTKNTEALIKSFCAPLAAGGKGNG
jgi:hypothetical protein